ncbi:MAG: (2Fe-2S)-binding protein [Hyphomicrobiales bacterium]
MRLNVNGEWRTVDAEDDKPLLWVIREDLGLRGTKFGCGAGLCGACTVHVDGEAVRSCSVPASSVDGATVSTIEGLTRNGRLAALQAAWIAEQVPQCGYCQPGFLMAASALLEDNPNPTQDEIRSEITNLCRCGTYQRIARAIGRAADAG